MMLIAGQAYPQQVSRPSQSAPLLSTTVGELRQRSVLTRRVSMHAANRPLGEVLRSLDRQAQLQLVYSSNIVPVATRVSVQADSVPVGDVLSQALRGLGLNIVVTSAGQVVLAGPLTESSKSGGAGILKGTVVDALYKRPVSNAMVTVLGTGLRATTDGRGGFHIANVPSGSHQLAGSLAGQKSTTQSFVMLDGAEIQVELIVGNTSSPSINSPLP